DRPVQYLQARDEGHRFRGEAYRRAKIESVERFLAEHLGGRHQEDVPENSANRIEEITVDPATVELPKPLDESELSADLPAPIRDLEPDMDAYVATIKVQEQEMTMDVTRTVEETTEGWRITEITRGPMGEVQDVEILAK